MSDDNDVLDVNERIRKSVASTRRLRERLRNNTYRLRMKRIGPGHRTLVLETVDGPRQSSERNPGDERL